MVCGFFLVTRASRSTIKCFQSTCHKENRQARWFPVQKETGHDFATSSDSKVPDSSDHTLSDSLQIYYFPLLRADLKISRFAVEFAGCMWREAVSGKKKLQIKKYLDACRWGLDLSPLNQILYNYLTHFY